MYCPNINVSKVAMFTNRSRFQCFGSPIHDAIKRGMPTEEYK